MYLEIPGRTDIDIEVNGSSIFLRRRYKKETWRYCASQAVGRDRIDPWRVYSIDGSFDLTFARGAGVEAALTAMIEQYDEDVRNAEGEEDEHTTID